MNQVKFLKLRRDAVLPEKKTDGAAGYDLYVPDNTLIRKGRNLIKLGIAIQMPSNMKAIIKPRSGFSLKGIIGVDGKYHDADVLDGVIDCDYTGCIGVIVKSFEKEPFYIVASFFSVIILRLNLLRLKALIQRIGVMEVLVPQII